MSIQSTETLSENNSLPTHKTRLQLLAEAIDGIPHNHDDRVMLIRDMIKKHIHSEKADVYSNLKHWAESDWQKQMFTDKYESHKLLAEKWQYNTPYSLKNYKGGLPNPISKAFERLGAEITITRE